MFNNKPQSKFLFNLYLNLRNLPSESINLSTLGKLSKLKRGGTWERVQSGDDPPPLAGMGLFKKGLTPPKINLGIGTF